MNDTQINQAAAILVEARLARDRFEALPDELVPTLEGDAYRLQEVVHGLLTAHGQGDFAGHKIGCTTAVMQAYLGIHNPSAGGVLRAETHASGAVVQVRGANRLGVECEVAVRLSCDLPPRSTAAPYDRATVGAAVGECMAAIEIVEDRYVDYGALDAQTLIADDFFGAGVVLGRPVAGFDPEALDEVFAQMLIDGSEVGSGRGEDVLGHPLEALAWLARSASTRGITLRAGEFVMLGSLVATHWIDPGSEVQIINDMLGDVSVSFVA